VKVLEKIPILTMTKSRISGEIPKISSKSQSLLDTLTGLCSFHTAEDLASFLFTDMFRDLVGVDEPWIVFEIGSYKDHTRTLECIPVHDGITIADVAMTGIIENNVTVVKSETECGAILSNWYDYTANG